MMPGLGSYLIWLMELPTTVLRRHRRPTAAEMTARIIYWGKGNLLTPLMLRCFSLVDMLNAKDVWLNFNSLSFAPGPLNLHPCLCKSSKISIELSFIYYCSPPCTLRPESLPFYYCSCKILHKSQLNIVVHIYFGGGGMRNQESTCLYHDCYNGLLEAIATWRHLNYLKCLR